MGYLSAGDTHQRIMTVFEDLLTPQTRWVVPTHTMKNPVVWLILLVVAASVVLMVKFGDADRDQESDATSHPAVGESISMVSLVRLTGSGTNEQVSLNDLAGKVVLINVWGTWCPPCIQELPHIANMQQQFATRDNVVVLPISYGMEGLVSTDEQLEELRSTTAEFLEQRGLSMTTYGDVPGETYRSLQTTLGRVNFPTNVVLDRNGVVRAVWEGYAPGMEREVERLLRKVLDES